MFSAAFILHRDWFTKSSTDALLQVRSKDFDANYDTRRQGMNTISF